MTKERIIYTETDEAPALATYSFLPVVKVFAGAADVARRGWDRGRRAGFLHGVGDGVCVGICTEVSAGTAGCRAGARYDVRLLAVFVAADHQFVG